MIDKLADPKWQRRMMQQATLVGSWSKDPHCKVGALVVSPDARQVSWGFNGLPWSLPDRGLEDSEWKNRFMVHAERNAILNSPVDIVGWTIVSTKFPCLECAKEIVSARLARIVTADFDTGSSWLESQQYAFGLLQSTGMDIVQLRVGL